MANIRSPNGGFAEYALGEETTATIIPDSVSFVEAAALPTAGWYHFNTIALIKTKDCLHCFAS